MRSLPTLTEKTLFKTLTETTLRRCQKTAAKRRISPVNLTFSTTPILATAVNQSGTSLPPVQNPAQPLTARCRRSS